MVAFKRHHTNAVMSYDIQRAWLSGVRVLSVFILLLVLTIALAGALRPKSTDVPRTPSARVLPVTNPPTNFVEEGVLNFELTGTSQDRPSFSYRDGSVTTTVSLIIDHQSVCGTSQGAILCMAMSVQWSIPFGGKRAIVEAVDEEGALHVRKIRILNEGEQAVIPPVGEVYTPWPQVAQLIRDCKVDMITQSHDLNVRVTLDDGTKIVTVEPVIDEVLTILKETRASCGDVMFATE